MGHLRKEKRDKLHTGLVSVLKFKVTGRSEVRKVSRPDGKSGDFNVGKGRLNAGLSYELILWSKVSSLGAGCCS